MTVLDWCLNHGWLMVVLMWFGIWLVWVIPAWRKPR